MLTCDEASAYLLCAVDHPDWLDSAGRAALNRHLAACLHCRRELDDQRAVAALLQARPPDDISEDFSAALAARLDAANSWLTLADWRIWTFRLSPAAAILALMALLWPSAGKPETAGVDSISLMTLADPTSPDAVLWQFGAPADAVVETMLIGRRPGVGSSDDVR